MTWYEWIGVIWAVVWFYSMPIVIYIEVVDKNNVPRKIWLLCGLIIAIIASTITIIKSI